MVDLDELREVSPRDGRHPDSSTTRQSPPPLPCARLAALTSAICRCLPEGLGSSERHLPGGDGRGGSRRRDLPRGDWRAGSHWESRESRQLRDAIRRNDANALLHALDRALNHRQKLRFCLSQRGDGGGGLLEGALLFAVHGTPSLESSHLVRVLIQHGANVNALGVDRSTPLHHAARVGSATIVGALLEDPTVRFDLTDAHGDSALRVAVLEGHWECAQLLIRAGASTRTLAPPPSSGRRLCADALTFGDSLEGARLTLCACRALWPPPTVRCCAVGYLSGESAARALLVNAMAPVHVIASAELESEMADAEATFGGLFAKVIHTERVLQHPLLTVSTEVGMMHYELHAPSRLLFMAITLPDLQQANSSPPHPSPPRAHARTCVHTTASCHVSPATICHQPPFVTTPSCHHSMT